MSSSPRMDGSKGVTSFLKRGGHDVTDQLKFGIAVALGNGGLATGEGVIGADHLFAGLHQPVHQVGAHDTSATDDQFAHRPLWHDSALSHDPSIQASWMGPAAPTVLVQELNNQAGRAALAPQREAKPAQRINMNPEDDHPRYIHSRYTSQLAINPSGIHSRLR